MGSDHASGQELTAEDRAYRAAQVVRDRLAGGAPDDDPLTREALATLTREFESIGRGQAPDDARD